MQTKLNHLMYLRLLFVTKVLGACAIAFNTAACQDSARAPHRYLVPSDYVGWVRIDSALRDSPKLTVENGFYLFLIPKEGLLQTSSKPSYGVAEDEYYYYLDNERRRLPVTQSGAGGMIWGRFNGSSTGAAGESIYEYFFVGTEVQFETLGKKALAAGQRPQVGNLNQRQKID